MVATKRRRPEEKGRPPVPGVAKMKKPQPGAKKRPPRVVEVKPSERHRLAWWRTIGPLPKSPPKPVRPSGRSESSSACCVLAKQSFAFESANIFALGKAGSA